MIDTGLFFENHLKYCPFFKKLSPLKKSFTFVAKRWNVCYNRKIDIIIHVMHEEIVLA